MVDTLQEYLEKAATPVGGKTKAGYTVKMVGGKRTYTKDQPKQSAQMNLLNYGKEKQEHQERVERYQEKMEAKKERLENRAEKKRAEASQRFDAADMSEGKSGIPFGQPILVGHHSEKRHRRAIERSHQNMGRAVEAQREAEHLEDRAANVGTGGISSDDPEAVIKLNEKIAAAEQSQAAMKRINKIVKKKGMTVEVLAKEANISEKNARNLLEPDFGGRIGFPGYSLTNNNANIRRMKQRVDTLRAEAKREERPPIEGRGYRVEENKEDNRIRMFFDGKPSKEVRTKLKRSGFRWSPMAGAWQRHLNESGRYAVEQMVKELFPVDESEDPVGNSTGEMDESEDPVGNSTGEIERSMDAIGELDQLTKAKPSPSADISPEKARQILHDGTVHGKPVTEQQRKFFGAIGGHLPAPKAEKSMSGIEELGEYVEKAGQHKYIKRTGTPGHYIYQYYEGPGQKVDAGPKITERDKEHFGDQKKLQGEYIDQLKGTMADKPEGAMVTAQHKGWKSPKQFKKLGDTWHMQGGSPESDSGKRDVIPGLSNEGMARFSVLAVQGGGHYAHDVYPKKAEKSMKDSIDELGEYMAKADTSTVSPQHNSGDAGKISGDNSAGDGGLPGGEPGMGHGEEDGGELAGKGKQGTGEGPAGMPHAASAKPGDKLSEDDEAAEEQMKEKELRAGQRKMAHKSMATPTGGNYTRQEIDATAAQAKAAVIHQIRKGEEDLTIVGNSPQPAAAPEAMEKAVEFRQGMIQHSNAADIACDNLQKADGFYHGEAPSMGPSGNLHARCLCANGHEVSKALSSCPTCGVDLQKGGVLGGGFHEQAPNLMSKGNRLVPTHTPDMVLPNGYREDNIDE